MLHRIKCRLGWHTWMQEKKVLGVRVKPGVWAEYRTRMCWFCPRVEAAPARVYYLSTGSADDAREGA
jgi:hypothetical protein